MHSSHPNKSSLAGSIVLLIVITLVITASGWFAIGQIRAYCYEKMQIESRRLANSYVQSLATSLIATNVVNSLLEEKIRVAGQAALSIDGQIGSDFLARVAAATEVDVIYVYDKNGQAVCASDKAKIGWIVPGGHPIRDFMQSGEQSLIEQIRPNTITGTHWKYGYFRTPDGGLIQVGVLAKSICDFLGHFEKQRLLEQIETDPQVAMICFIDNSLHIAARCGAPVEEKILTGDALYAMAADRQYETNATLSGMRLHILLLPIRAEGEKFGTLLIGYDLAQTERMIRSLSLAGITLLVLFIAILAWHILTGHRKRVSLLHSVYHDHLTGLPNKEHFEAVVNSALQKSPEGKRAVLLVNYRNFRQINLTFGYHHGELLIKDLAVNLTRLCTPKRRLFHLSNDRFALYVEDYRDRDELVLLCEKAIDILKSTLVTKTIGGNVGVIERTGQSEDADSLLKYASIAAENVNETEHFGYCFYDSHMEARIIREEEIIRTLSAIALGEDRDSLQVVYQPILQLKSDGICAFEALARLKAGSLGLVAPGEFIPIAEKTQLIVPLGASILRVACGFLSRLEGLGEERLKISVNISVIQLMRDEFFPELMRIVEESGITPCNLVIEITESVFLDNYQAINSKLANIMAQGIRIAIDDFGTGYSNLARVRELNVNYLKIDRYFMDKLLRISMDESITGDIISIAHKLNYTVVAEGVQDERQAAYLRRHGCDCAQGFLYSKPLAEPEALKFLEAHARSVLEKPG